MTTLRKSVTNTRAAVVTAGTAAPTGDNGRKDIEPHAPHTVEAPALPASSQNILLLLIAFRILNALSVKTFFQPDEYFQSLEPAWAIAFGPKSGAWITWEWQHHLRSAIHPYLFATIYRLADLVSGYLQISPIKRTELLIAAPKVLQAVIAGAGDFYTWKLGEKIYGKGTYAASAALIVTVCSPWQWFVSTRTLSNCLETTLTIAGLALWPWQWSDSPDGRNMRASQMKSLRISMLLAAFACVLRPTNVLVWLFLASIQVLQSPFQQARLVALLREAVLCGSAVLMTSALLDRSYYQQWTFPPLRFLEFNISQSLAVLYGQNDWHYYITQGYPLLLTTLLPFAVIGLYKGLTCTQTSSANGAVPARFQLSAITLFVPFVLSFISHKEVRFIYPVLPILHVLAAQPFASFFKNVLATDKPIELYRTLNRRTFALAALLGVNVLIAMFASQNHQPAPISVLEFLRHEHEQHYFTGEGDSSDMSLASTMTVGFLMPCHSTPWRSHLVYPDIKAWALGCEPPVHFNISARAAYRDEADQFYDNPALFLKQNLEPPQQKKNSFGIGKPKEIQITGLPPSVKGIAWDGKSGIKFWPSYLVFFQALEPLLRDETARFGGSYTECWRGWNSFGHDDERRMGDIIVWCLRK